MRSTLITNLTLLVGDEFQEIDNANLLIENGTIRYFGREQPDTGTDAVTVDGATCLNPSAITSAEILRMVTASAADILGLGSTIGTLDVGKRADIVFLNLTAPNLNFSKDLVSSVVHRARPENVACVMIDGEIVHGSIEN